MGGYCEETGHGGSDGVSSNTGLAIGLGTAAGVVLLTLIIALSVYFGMRNTQQRYAQSYGYKRK